MAKYPFLSDEWVEASRALREEYKDQIPEVTVSVRMNQIIKEVPFGDGIIETHVDTTSGQLVMEHGHLEAPDLTLTLDYATAKALLVNGDAQAAMTAFMSGKIKVDGDITKMIALQTAGAATATNPAAAEMVKRLQDLTE